MSNENLEFLVEQLVAINQGMFAELEAIKDNISEIKEELNWVKEHSYANMVVDKLSELESQLTSIDMNVSSVDINTSDY